MKPTASVLSLLLALLLLLLLSATTTTLSQQQPTCAPGQNSTTSNNCTDPNSNNNGNGGGSNGGCPPDYWGASCTELCMCRQPVAGTDNVTQWPLRGLCDRFTGVCTCDADTTRGFWAGATCSACQDGYIGSACRLREVVMSQFSPVEYSGTIVAFTTPTGTTQIQQVAQPRHWLPHVTRSREFVIMSGSALVVLDERDIQNGGGESFPVVFDVSENFASGCAAELFKPWVSSMNGRLYVAISPSLCHPDELRIYSTYEPDRLRFFANPPRPGTVARQHVRYEGFVRMNMSREIVLSSSHGIFVDDWIQFCVVFYQWNEPDIDPNDPRSPWNLRCVPTSHRIPGSPGYTVLPVGPERVVANSYITGGLQDLRGILYWPTLDAILIFGSSMTRGEQLEQQSSSSSSATAAAGNQQQQKKNGMHQWGGCHLSVMWRNQSISFLGPWGIIVGLPTALRDRCRVIERVILLRDREILITATFDTFVGVMLVTINSTHPLPTLVHLEETSIPTDYTTVSATFGIRGVVLAAHCARQAFWNWESIASSTVTSVGGGSTGNTTTTSSSSTATSSSLQSQCLISRFNYNTQDKLAIIVTQLASDAEIPITALTMSSDQNAVFAVMSRAQEGFLVRRYLGWAILRAQPPLAEVQGGTPITVLGTGFAVSPGHDLFCAFQPFGALQSATALLKQNKSAAGTGGVLTGDSIVTTFVRATLINDRSVVCPAAAVTRTSGCSNVDTVDLTIFDDRFTGHGTSIIRFQQPSIISTNPRSVFANGASTLPITVIGSGFQPTTVARCRFASNVSGPLVTLGTFVSSTGIRCTSPPRVLPLSPDATVDVAVDGFKYTGQPVSVTIFGRPSGIQFTADSVRVTDGSGYRLGVISVISIDASGNPTSEGLGLLPVIMRTVARLCEPMSPNPCTEDDVLAVVNGSSAPEARLAGNTGGAMVDGTATFTQLEVNSKKATGFNGTVPNYVMLVAFIPDRAGWYTTAKLFIDTGKPVALIIVDPVAPTVSDQGDMAATPSISAVDVGNNVVVLGVESWEGQADVLEDPLPPGVTLLEPPELIPNRPRFTLFTNGVAEFLQIPVHARHGVTYRIRFSVRRNDQVKPVTSGPIQSYCPPGYFKLPGLYSCQTCLAHATCDGDNVSVNAGYWRSSVLSTDVVECPTTVACPGGTAPGVCAPNYRGPRCDLCDAGFGRGVTGTCDACPHTAVSGFVMMLIVVGLTVLLALFTTYAIQNSDRPMPRVVVLQQLVTHVQTLAILTSLDNPWPQYLIKMAQWIDAVADFRVMDTSFGECLISAYDLDFTGKFFFQLVLLGEIFLCIACVKALLFLRPNFMKSDIGDHNTLIAKGVKRVPLPITTLRIIVPAVLCGLFFLHQGTLMYAFGVLDCIEIDLGNGVKDKVLLVDPSISCDSATYRGVVFIAYPIIVLLGICVPLGLAITYEAHKFFRTEERNLRYQLGAFLLAGVNPGSWYWPVLIFLRKGIMVLIVTLLKWPFDAFFLQWIFVLYLVLLEYVRPYVEYHFRVIDKFSVIINILVINLGTLYHTTRSSAVQTAIAPVVIVLEILATIAFSLLISNSWRKWVFVRLRIEKPDLEVETADSVLQLHEILQERDFMGDHPSGFGKGEVHDDVLEMLPLSSRAAPKMQRIGDDEERKNQKITPNFGDEWVVGDGDEQLRSVDQLPSKVEAAAAEKAMRKRREHEELQLRLMQSNGDDDDDDDFAELNRRTHNNSGVNTTSTTPTEGKLAHLSRRSSFNNNSNSNNNHIANRPPAPKRPTSVATHNPMLSSKGAAAAALHDIKNGGGAGSSAPQTEYRPAAVPLPNALNKFLAKQEMQEARQRDMQLREEEERQKQRERQQLEMQLRNGPKVVRAPALAVPATRAGAGFEEYRAKKAQEELDKERGETMRARSAATSGWRPRFTELDTSNA